MTVYSLIFPTGNALPPYHSFCKLCSLNVVPYLTSFFYVKFFLTKNIELTAILVHYFSSILCLFKCSVFDNLLFHEELLELARVASQKFERLDQSPGLQNESQDQNPVPSFVSTL